MIFNIHKFPKTPRSKLIGIANDSFKDFKDSLNIIGRYVVIRGLKEKKTKWFAKNKINSLDAAEKNRRTRDAKLTINFIPPLSYVNIWASYKYSFYSTSVKRWRAILGQNWFGADRCRNHFRDIVDIWWTLASILHLTLCVMMSHLIFVGLIFDVMCVMFTYRLLYVFFPKIYRQNQ